MQAAKKAFPDWSSRSPAERGRVLNKLADLLEAHLEEFAQAESKDQGTQPWQEHDHIVSVVEAGIKQLNFS